IPPIPESALFCWAYRTVDLTPVGTSSAIDGLNALELGRGEPTRILVNSATLKAADSTPTDNGALDDGPFNRPFGGDGRDGSRLTEQRCADAVATGVFANERVRRVQKTGRFARGGHPGGSHRARFTQVRQALSSRRPWCVHFVVIGIVLGGP